MTTTRVVKHDVSVTYTLIYLLGQQYIMFYTILYSHRFCFIVLSHYGIRIRINLKKKKVLIVLDHVLTV